MKEVAVVCDREGHTLAWHQPSAASAGGMPDSRGLWDAIWSNRDVVGGVAHTHPPGSAASPSWEDVTTFSAIELAIGRRLHWWIFTNAEGACYRWVGPGAYAYARVDSPPFVVMAHAALIEASEYGGNDERGT